jgi:hypothetical protein
MRKSACSVSTDIKPKYCRVRRHLSLGVVEVKLVGDDLFLGTSKVKFFLSEKQKRGDRTSGFEVLKDLESMGGIALNYSVLSYLLAHTKLWPRKLWPLPGKRNSFDAPTVYFPGTVFAPASDPLPKERSEAGDWVWGLKWMVAIGFVIPQAFLCDNWGSSQVGGEPPEFQDLAGSIAYVDKV